MEEVYLDTPTKIFLILCVIGAESIAVYRDMSLAQSSEKRARLLKSSTFKKTQPALHLWSAGQIKMLFLIELFILLMVEEYF